jgi:predicted Zn-dependent protease
MIKKYAIITGLILAVLIPCSATIASEENNNNQENISTKTDHVAGKYGFTLLEEKEIGFQSAVILAKRYGYYKNSKVNQYVNKIGQSIAEKVSTRPDIEYSFYVLDSPEINAFAVPGGFIFITRGALKIISNEAELVGVLAHEIAHIEQGHGLKAIAGNPEIRDKIRVMKINLQEGKGFTQQSLRGLLSKEKNITSGIVNAGKLTDDIIIEQNNENNFIIKQ